jgi:hypothetical protein
MMKKSSVANEILATRTTIEPSFRMLEMLILAEKIAIDCR